MNATMYATCPLGERPPLLRVVPAPKETADADLRIDAGVAIQWRALPAAGRARLSAFLAGARGGEFPRCECTNAALPEAFARDLAYGGPLLRAAFPELVRCVKRVDRRTDRVVVRVACEGRHDGAFFGILSPTGRHVAFDVVHDFAMRDGYVVEHRVSLDVPAILSQLVAGPRSSEPATAPSP
jgi:hypothetical protein